MAVLSDVLGAMRPPKKKSFRGNQVFPVPAPHNPYQPYAPLGQNHITTALGGGGISKRAGRTQDTDLGAQGVPHQVPVDYESDPVLMRIRALGSQNVANARAEAAAQRRRAVVESGLAEFAPDDPNTMTAARQNPFSAANLLLREFTERNRNVNEGADNLFYSGARQRLLEDLGFQQAQKQASLTQQLRDMLYGLDRGVLEAEQDAYNQEQDVLLQIAERERQEALKRSLIESLAVPGRGVSPPGHVTNFPGFGNLVDLPQINVPNRVFGDPVPDLSGTHLWGRPRQGPGRSIFDPIFGL